MQADLDGYGTTLLGYQIRLVVRTVSSSPQVSVFSRAVKTPDAGLLHREIYRSVWSWFLPRVHVLTGSCSIPTRTAINFRLWKV
jgi:hypothetical protein